jgi:hypothetical protein
VLEGVQQVLLPAGCRTVDRTSLLRRTNMVRTIKIRRSTGEEIEVTLPERDPIQLTDMAWSSTFWSSSLGLWRGFSHLEPRPEMPRCIL